LIVLIDMDGPLADFEGHMLACWRRCFPQEAFVPLRDRSNFWAREQYARIDPRYPGMLNRLVGSADFFRSMPVVVGARKAVREMRQQGIQIYFCSSPLPQFPETAAAKLEWVGENFGSEMVSRTILTQDKTLVVGSILIDDNPGIKGAIRPHWKQVLWDMPFNRNAVGFPRMKRWASWPTFVGNGNKKF